MPLFLRKYWFEQIYETNKLKHFEKYDESKFAFNLYFNCYEQCMNLLFAFDQRNKFLFNKEESNLNTNQFISLDE